MLTGTKRAGLGFSVLAALVMGLFFAWLFSLQGSKGLGAWGYNHIYLAIAAIGILPCLVSLGALLAKEDSLLGTILGWAGMALAILAVAGIVILFRTIYTRAHTVKGPLAGPKVLNPVSGIAPADQGSPATGPVLHLALSSDPHWGAENAAAAERTAILKAVAAEKPARDAFFILGDNTQMGWNDAEWRAEVTDLAQNLGSLPVRPILGNHDAIIDGEYHFLNYFMPRKFSTGSGSPYYYAIDAGPALVVVLDLLWGSESFDRSQRLWLEKTLAAVPAGKRVIVLSHCFFASSGYTEGSQQWYDHPGTLGDVAPILEKHKVDLVVQGHNHYMELLKRNGVTYATIGVMGGHPDPEPTHISPSSLWLQRGSYGYLDLDVSASGITLSFKNQDGVVVHSAQVGAGKQ